MRILIGLVAVGLAYSVQGCSNRPKPVTTTDVVSSDAPQPNTTDIISVDQKAGTFVALVRRDHTTDRVVARCGIQCPTLGKNFAGFWSIPASQVDFFVIQKTEMDGLHAE
jgi:hypothetical protein